jgi:hypothetical protein
MAYTMTNMQAAVSDYIKLRNGLAKMKAEHKQREDRIRDAMDTIEKLMLEEFNNTGVDSVKTKAGTAYRTILTSASVTDKQAFMDFVLGGNQDLLDARVNKTNALAYTEENDELPPGVKITRLAKVNIRQS